jgi:hypothetical protein
MVGTEELVEAGLILMEEARHAKSGSARQGRTFRNGLMIALLCWSSDQSTNEVEQANEQAG